MDRRAAGEDLPRSRQPAESLSRRGKLPAQLTSFVGRERELATLREQLLTARLVTLVGVGGSGKTRLAIEIASEVEIGLRHGAVFVDLAPLSDAAVIPQAIIQALGGADIASRSSEEALDALVGGSDGLLLLDNCEHLIDACAALVGRLLRGSPHLRVLATSREPLDIEGEVTVVVPPLELPPLDGKPVMDYLDRYGAIRLFCERAASARPGFAIDDGNAAAVARICHGLDGLPLAIELAAARLRSMSTDELVERLDDRFSLLKRTSRAEQARHRTLRATVDWSHELLSDGERVLFRRLAVFAGGWRVADAEIVCADELLESASILDLHTRLVDRSLVIAELGPSGPTRYRFLETLRQYAAERLQEDNNIERIRRRHFDHFLAMAVRYYRERMIAGSDAGLGELAAHRDNLRAALAWSADVDQAAALRLGHARRLLAHDQCLRRVAVAATDASGRRQRQPRSHPCPAHCRNARGVHPGLRRGRWPTAGGHGSC
jgi:predicted ATPase